MPSFERTYRIRKSPAEVFDVIGTHMVENHPRWEPEVVEIRPLTPGPMGVGSRAVMVRQEYGRRRETTYEVVAFERDRLVAVSHVDAGMAFDLSFAIAPADNAATDLTVRVRMAPRGLMRLMTPLLALGIGGRSDRIARSMVSLVEGSRELTPTSPAVAR